MAIPTNINTLLSGQVDLKKASAVTDGDSRNIILYYDEDNSPRVEVLFREEMLWMNQKQIAELFGVNRQAVTKHLKNIYDEGELNALATSSKMELVQKEGNREVKRDCGNVS